MNIDSKKIIESFKSKYPEIDSNDVEHLVKTVASECMQYIVANIELNGSGLAQNAWYNIKEHFDVTIHDESQLLPFNRPDKYELFTPFKKACEQHDFDKIKEILSQFIKLHYSAEDNILTELIEKNNLPVFQFFIDDEFIRNHRLYHNMLGFERQKGTLFSIAYHYKRLDFIEYLIFEKHAEFTPEAQQTIKNDKTDFKSIVLNLIQSKHLNYSLNLSLNEKNVNKKTKI